MSKNNISVLIIIINLLFVFKVGISQSFEEQTGIVLPGIQYSSVSWGDYDNDQDLDILLNGRTGSSEYISKIYKNNGDNTFSEQSGILLPGVSNSKSDWGDIDNDGFLDIILNGYTGSEQISKIFKNNGDNTFSEYIDIIADQENTSFSSLEDYDNDGDLDLMVSYIKPGDAYDDPEYHIKILSNNGQASFAEVHDVHFEGLTQGSVYWVDYDNDGDMDIACNGKGGWWYFRIYKNEDNNEFIEQIDIALPGVNNGTIEWEDFNNDGWLDLLISGFSNSGDITKIFKNNGDNSFTEQTQITFSYLDNISVDWGDYDNDGYIDLILGGYSSVSGSVTKLFKNNGDETFTEQTSESFIGINGIILWGDYDNDEKLDIVLSGNTGSGFSTNIYKNINSTSNTSPTVPINLSHEIIDHTSIFNWDKSSDLETSQDGLTYNIYVSTVSNTDNKKNSSSHIPVGYRKIVKRGNTGSLNTDTLEGLHGGETYYWGVQAIDNGFLGSAFSTEQVINMPIIRPTVQAGNIVQTGGNQNTAEFRWENGNSTKRVVFMSDINVTTAVPSDNITYNPDSNFGLGSQIGTSGLYCVYNGSDNYTTITGLQEATEYKVYVFEYDGTPGNELYNIDIIDNVDLVETIFFSEHTDFDLQGNNIGCPIWGDYDNDGDLDLLMSTYNDSLYSKIFKNNGDKTFSLVPDISLNRYPSIGNVWTDYNHDGDLDVLFGYYDLYLNLNNGNNSFSETVIQVNSHILNRNEIINMADYDHDGDIDLLTSDQSRTSLYKNNGDYTYTNQNLFMEYTGGGQYYSQWFDFNNDAYPDFIKTSYDYLIIYKNNQDETFSESDTISFEDIEINSINSGDFDNDGYQDLIVIGLRNYEVGVLVFCNNNGDNTFSHTTYDISFESTSSSAVGDYDNDGDLDVVISGKDKVSQEGITRVFKNKGDGVFKEQFINTYLGSEYFFSPYDESRVNWADYDNDGDLDLLVALQSDTGKVYRLYDNNYHTPNNEPSSPSNLQSNINGRNVDLSWDKSNDIETGQDGLSYNLYISESSYAENINPALSDLTNGYRKVIREGNAYSNNFFTIKDLLGGQTYYWSVQAIDNSFSGGHFTTEQTFFMPVVRPDIQTSDIIQTGATDSSIIIKWTNGNGSRRAVFVSAEGTSTVLPADNINYIPNKQFGLGSEIGTSGWYCVYSGVEDYFEFFGLEGATYYQAAIFEFDGIADSELYCTSINTNNGVTVKSSIFEDQKHIEIDYAYYGTISWGDYDNDGDMDLLRSSQDTSVIYKNNGDNSFTSQDIVLPRIKDGSSVWTDFNNDGLLDMLFSGNYDYDDTQLITAVYLNNGDDTFIEIFNVERSASAKCAVTGDYNNDGHMDFMVSAFHTDGRATYIYKNNGDSTFTCQEDIELPYVRGPISWADYDNDGDLDIFLGGYSTTLSSYISKLYRNDGNNIFTDQIEVPFEPLYNGSSLWADLNKDGLLDLVLAGGLSSSNNDRINTIYKNNGDGTFCVQDSTTLIKLGYYARSSAGDYDNDGDMDLLMNGYSNYDYYTKIYKNDGNFNFEEQNTITLKGLSEGDLSWADYDNDGDLDLLITGRYETTVYKNLLINNLPPKTENIIPEQPSGINISVLSNDGTYCQVKYEWEKSSDFETPQDGLYYNFYLGTFEGEQDIINSMSLNTGERKFVNFGNSGSNTFCIIDSLFVGQKYFFGVQTVDGGFKASPFTINESNIDIESLQQSIIFVYPNPTQGILNIEFANENIKKITISDLLGKILIKKTSVLKNEKFDLSNYTSGVYIVSIQTDKGLVIAKILKE